MSCPSCLSGGVNTSSTTGKEMLIHGRQTYVSEPENGITPKGLIIVITDAFGWQFVNNRVLCDRYAKQGEYLVYCPDFMDGNALPPSILPLMDNLTGSSSLYTALVQKPIWAYQVLSHAIPWKLRTKPALTHPGIVAYLQAIRASPPPFPTEELKIGVAGFCWGGKHAFMLAADREGDKSGLVDAVFTAHPSYIAVPYDIEAVRIPMSVAVGDEDMVMKAPLVAQMKELFDARNREESDARGKGERGEGRYEVVVFKGAKHGFAIRTHPEDEEEIRCVAQAEEQALKWFGRWVG